MDPVSVTPIGRVHSPRKEATDDFWGSVVSTIELDSSRFGPEALLGLTEFSHLEVVFHLDRVPDEKVLWTAGHPRGNQDWPRVGIFALQEG